MGSQELREEERILWLKGKTTSEKHKRQGEPEKTTREPREKKLK